MVPGMRAETGCGEPVGGRLTARRHGIRDEPAPVAGAMFGLPVWGASFQALLPALGIKEATTEHPPKRWPAPLTAHTVFGVVTAAVAAKVDPGLA